MDSARRIQLITASLAILTGLGAPLSCHAAGGSMAGPEPQATQRLVWVDREGKSEAAIGEPSPFISGPVFSPDGRRIATWESVGGNRDIYVRSLTSGEAVRVTDHSAVETQPAWLSNGDRIGFVTYRNGNADVYLTTTTSTPPLAILAGPLHEYYPDWTPDDATLVYHDWDPETDQRDIRIRDMEGGESAAFIAGPAVDALAQVSPDGSLLAYQSNETGDWHVFVTAFPEGGRKIRVSSQGGVWPRWADEGELFYIADGHMVVSAVERNEDIRPSPPQPLWALTDLGMQDPMSGVSTASFFSPRYDVSPDGEGFVIVRSVEPTRPN